MRTTFCLILAFAISGAVKAQVISRFAGSGVGGGNTGDGGPATIAKIDYPIKGVFDKYGNYYFATGTQGNSVRKIDASGIITTVAGTGSSGFSGDSGLATNARLNNAQSVALDTNGNIYVSDSWNNRIRKIDRTTGTITTIAGIGTVGFSGDGGNATAAELHGPLDICFDWWNNLYICDYGNSRVRMVNSSSGTISTYAGGGGGDDSIQATASQIGAWGICADKTGEIYVSDGSRRIRKINTTGIITTVAGNSSFGGHSGDGGQATTAKVEPYYLTVDEFGNIFFTETTANYVRMINSSGVVNTIIGNGTPGSDGDGGAAVLARVNYPCGVEVDSCGNLYVAEGHSWRIRKVTYPHCNYLSITEINNNKSVNVYPNPVYDELNVENVIPGTCFSISDVSGRIMQSGSFPVIKNNISVSSYPPGLYFLYIYNQNQQSVYKIIKQ
jgi:hypothetical protein